MRKDPLITDAMLKGIFLRGPDSVIHEYTYHRLVSTISKPPNSLEANNFDVDFNIFDHNGFIPTLFLPLSSPVFKGALSRKGNIISADLFHIPDEDFHQILNDYRNK